MSFPFVKLVWETCSADFSFICVFGTNCDKYNAIKFLVEGRILKDNDNQTYTEANVITRQMRSSTFTESGAQQSAAAGLWNMSVGHKGLGKI